MTEQVPRPILLTTDELAEKLETRSSFPATRLSAGRGLSHMKIVRRFLNDLHDTEAYERRARVDGCEHQEPSSRVA